MLQAVCPKKLAQFVACCLKYVVAVAFGFIGFDITILNMNFQFNGARQCRVSVSLERNQEFRI